MYSDNFTYPNIKDTFNFTLTSFLNSDRFTLCFYMYFCRKIKEYGFKN